MSKAGLPYNANENEQKFYVPYKRVTEFVKLNFDEKLNPKDLNEMRTQIEA